MDVAVVQNLKPKGQIQGLCYRGFCMSVNAKPNRFSPSVPPYCFMGQMPPFEFPPCHLSRVSRDQAGQLHYPAGSSNCQLLFFASTVFAKWQQGVSDPFTAGAFFIQLGSTRWAGINLIFTCFFALLDGHSLFSPAPHCVTQRTRPDGLGTYRAKVLVVGLLVLLDEPRLLGTDDHS